MHQAIRIAKRKLLWFTENVLWTLIQCCVGLYGERWTQAGPAGSWQAVAWCYSSTPREEIYVQLPYFAVLVKKQGISAQDGVLNSGLSATLLRVTVCVRCMEPFGLLNAFRFIFFCNLYTVTYKVTIQLIKTINVEFFQLYGQWYIWAQWWLLWFRCYKLCI